MDIIRGDDIPFTPASHEDPQDPGVLKRVLATKNDLIVGHVQMVNWSRLPVGKAFRSHYHEDMQEVFVIVNGAVGMEVDGTTHELTGGDAILIDPHEVHAMTNNCDQDVNYLVFGISTGGGGKTVVCGHESGAGT